MCCHRRHTYYPRKIDPFTAKLVETFTAQAAKHGPSHIRKLLRSDYKAFWKSFARTLREDPNVPWDEVEAAHLQPEFVGIAYSLIEGNKGARKALREYFSGLELPDSAYETSEEVQEKVFKAALRAANEAPEKDREASFAAEKRLTETIEGESADLKARIDKILEKFESGAPQEAEQWEVVREHQRQGDDLLRMEGPPRDEASLAPQEEISSTATDGESVEDLLAELEQEDQEGAAVLRERCARDGVMGVVQFLRAPGESRSVASLDKAASIVALDGFFAEAERAHLEAAGLALEPRDQARQLVRAASMARLQGAEDRHGEHLDKARTLEPDLPGLAIFEARTLSDGQQMLERVAGIEPESEQQRAILHITRAQGWLLLGEPENARTELTRAEETGINTLPVREMKGLVAWVEARAALRDGKSPEKGSLIAAAQEFEAVAARASSQQRYDEAAHVVARAVEVYALAEDTSRAVELLGSVNRPEALPHGARAALGEAAILAHRPDLVSKFVPSPDGTLTTDRLWADAQLLREDADPATREKAVEILMPLLESEDSDLRAQSAFALIGGAAANLDVEWNQRAAEIVRERMPIAEASMRAERLQNEGKMEQAEAALLPFAADPKALQQLRDYAAAREDWTKARDRSGQLFTLSHKAMDRLALADATRKAGDQTKAKEDFLAVARDREVEDRLRGMGYSGAVEVAANDRDYEEVRKIASEWHSQLPDDANGLWNLLFGLARVAQHGQAYALVEGESPDADTEERATLLAEILGRAAPKIEALRAIAALSDRYDRSVEALEAFFLKTSLEAEQEEGELPDDLLKRAQDAWATFPERFPDQQFMQVLKAPSTKEEFEQLLEEMGGADSARLQKEITQEIIEGKRPVNSLALAAPHSSIGRCWLGLGFLPLGFCMEQIDEAEAADASAAIGGAVIWDSSSVFVVGGLGKILRAALLAVFPGSRIPNETLEDADAAVESLPATGSQETVQDPDTGEFLGFREHSEAGVERLRYMSEGMLSLAKQFESAPGVAKGTDPELRDVYQRGEQRPWRAIVASLALAQRLELPLFSDDRWIRQAARSFGLRTFGTVALVEVLHEKGVLTSEQRTEIRRKLLSTGAWGVSPSGEELVEGGRESNGALDQFLLGALNDRAAWRTRPADYWHAILDLLNVVYDLDPGLLGNWIRRAIYAFNSAFPEVNPAAASRILLLFAWDIQDDPRISKACFQAIVDEVRALPRTLRDEAPVRKALHELLQIFVEESEQIRFLVFMRLISRLRGDDAFLFFRQYVQPNPPLTGGADAD